APGLLERLSGRRAHCVATLTRAGRVVMREAGEVLFREYGLSGIVSFNLSRHARPGDAIELDLAPEVDAWEVDKLVADRPGDAHALDGILDPTTAVALVGLAGGAQAGGLAWRVAPLVKGLPFRVEGLADTAHAQVTRGGIDVTALDARTLAARGHDGLFACGEALDVDGACGGYNLAWAWASGMTCGASAARHAATAPANAAAPSKDARAARAGTPAPHKDVPSSPERTLS
ncbi:NAD(P)/FAD-dependent oxidoreductase, partial [Parolsenella catena]|uniref:NAD(P)/FAD-dependent oxidoreductase n=1 Tax=Parolsenella catena TaxID=2003188 RepID=UPI0030780D11